MVSLPITWLPLGKQIHGSTNYNNNSPNKNAPGETNVELPLSVLSVASLNASRTPPGQSPASESSFHTWQGRAWCALCVFLVCSLSVLYVFFVCPLSVLCVFFMCSLSVLCVLFVCSLCVLWLFSIVCYCFLSFSIVFYCFLWCFIVLYNFLLVSYCFLSFSNVYYCFLFFLLFFMALREKVWAFDRILEFMFWWLILLLKK